MTGTDVWKTLKRPIRLALDADTDLPTRSAEKSRSSLYACSGCKVIRKVDEGADLIELQEILGHKSFTTTYEYLRSHILKKKF